MKITRIKYLKQDQNLLSRDLFNKTFNEIITSINQVVWPKGNDRFTIFPEKRGNGVKAIKNNCMSYLQKNSWELEKRMELGSRLKPGPIDAIKNISGIGTFAVEWETGNISSSHRALNKISLGLIEKKIIAGYLILPSRKLYNWLTDRIGNFPEIEPYFPLYENMKISTGCLGVIEIEHDETSTNVPKIAKGTDGRALK